MTFQTMYQSENNRQSLTIHAEGSERIEVYTLGRYNKSCAGTVALTLGADFTLILPRTLALKIANAIHDEAEEAEEGLRMAGAA